MTDARLTRSFFGLAAGEAIARLLAFLAMLIVARRLGPALYGVIGVASGILLYLNQVADGGVELSGVPAIARRADRLNSLISSTLTVRVLVALALTVIVVLVGLTLFPQPDGAVLALYALGLVFVAVGVRWVFVGLQRTAWVAGSRISGELAALLIVLIAVRDAADIALVPIAALTGSGVAALLMFMGLRKLAISPRVELNWQESRELFARAPHLVGFTLLGLVLFNADLLYLRIFAGQQAAGYYTAAYTFIAFAANLSVAWSHSNLPALARRDAGDAQRNEAYERAMLLAFALTLPVALGGMLTAPALLELVFGERFAPAAQALVWLLPVVPVAAVREIAVVGLIATPGGERRLIRVNAICAAFNIAILLPVVPRYGLPGAAAVTVLTEILRLILAFRFARAAGYRAPAPGRFFRPAVAAVAMGLILVGLGEKPLWQLVGAAAATYAGILIVTGVVRFERPFEVRMVV